MVATAGVYDRFELGVGTDYDRVNTWSAKLNLWESPSWSKNTAFSVGVYNVYGDKVDLYAMGRVDLDNFRVHAGYQRLDYVSSLVVGVDFALCENCDFQAEHITGKEGYSWFAVSGQVVDGLAIQVAVGRPNYASNRIQHFICFTGGFRF